MSELMSKPLTPAQQEILDFLSPIEAPVLHKHLKEVYRSAAFETDTPRQSLFALWYLIELIEKIK